MSPLGFYPGAGDRAVSHLLVSPALPRCWTGPASSARTRGSGTTTHRSSSPRCVNGAEAARLRSALAARMEDRARLYG